MISNDNYQSLTERSFRHVILLLYIKDQDGLSALHYIATTTQSAIGDEISKLLIDNGANINTQDVWGATALHYTGSLKFTEYLLGRNADTTLKNAKGWTALRQSIYDKNIGKVALIRKKTNWQEEIYSLTSEEKIGRSVYEPEKDMFDVPSDEERVYKLATHDCNTMIFSNVSAGMVLLELNYFGLPSLARAASRAAQREGLFKQCMTVMGFECKNNCSKDSKPVAPK
jgi:hypothetical protein